MDGRDETPAQRADRNWTDLLQELRVMQTGVQLIAGFLLTLPFQSRFDDLDAWQRGLYLALVVLSALTTAGVLSPIAVHRGLFGRQVKPRLVRAGHVVVQVVLLLVALLLAGITSLVFDVVVGRAAGLLAGGGALLVSVVLLLVVPLRARASHDPSRDPAGEGGRW